MVKLVAVDMDGTLLNSKKEIPPEIFPLIRRLREERGVLFVVASGRQYYNLELLFQPVWEDVLFLCENGALVMDRGRIIYQNPLAPAQVADLLAEARRIPGVSTILCGTRSAYIEDESDPDFVYNARTYYNRCLRLDSLDGVQDEICKLALFSEHAERDCMPHLAQRRGEFDICVSGERWVDVMKKNTNKGSALQALQRLYHIAPEETMAFGDYPNDLEMMQACYYSYAMANAHPLLLETCRFTARSNDEKGVILALREFFSL